MRENGIQFESQSMTHRIIHGTTILFSTSRNDDRLAFNAPKTISHCDCDIVDGSTLQPLYSVAGVSDTATSGCNTITAEFLPCHL